MNQEQREPCYPVGIAITHRFNPPLPIEDGVYEVPSPMGEDFTLMLFVGVDDPTHQTILLLPPGVSHIAERTGAIEESIEVIDEGKALRYFDFICATLSGVDGLRFKTRYTPDFPFQFNDSDKKTRVASPRELVAVYETSTEVINNFLLAAKCAFPSRFLYFPQFDEDYISPTAFNWLDFFYYIPTMEPQIRKPLFMRTLADRFEFKAITGQEYTESIKPIMTNRADHLVDLMAVSANRCLRDGEYEASLVMLESTFETLVKNAIENYYQGTLPVSEANRKIETVFKRETKDGGKAWVGIEELVNTQLPLCGLPKLSPELRKQWIQFRLRRHEVIHHYKEPVTKVEALQAFLLYQEMASSLFKRTVWYLGERPGFSVHFGSSNSKEEEE